MKSCRWNGRPTMLAAIGLLLASIAYGEESTARDPKAAAKRALAARAAAQEALGIISALPVLDEAESESLLASLSTHMLTEQKAYHRKDPGAKTAQDWLTRWRMQDFDVKVETARSRAQEQSPLPLQLDDILNIAAPDWRKKREQGAQAFAASEVGRVYPAARSRAVIRQRKQLLEAQRYPTQEDLNHRLNQLDQQRKGEPQPLAPEVFRGLDKWLKDYVTLPGPVFEELSREVNNLAAALSDGIGHQYQGQTDLIKAPCQEGHFPATLLTSSALQEHMLMLLKEGHHERPESKPPGYGVFEAVTALVRDAAGFWESRRLETYLDSSQVWRPTVQHLSDRIQSDLVGHVDPSSSIRQLSRELATAQRSFVAEEYAKRAGESGQADVRAYLEQALADNTALGSVWQKRVEQVVKQMLPPIRMSIAEQQYQQAFIRLASEAALPEPVITWFHDHGLNQAETFEQTVEGLNSDEATSLEGVQLAPFLAETRTMATSELNSRLKPSLDSLKKQLLLIQDIERQQVDQLREDVRLGASFDALYKKWEQQWQQGWEGTAQDLDETWRAMFARTRDQLNKTVRQLFESAEQTASAGTPAHPSQETDQQDSDLPASAEMTRIEVPAEAPGEEAEHTEDGQGQGAGDMQEAGMTRELRAFQGLADGVLSFSDLTGGRCRLLFGAPDGRGALEVEFDPVDIEESAKLIAQTLSIPLRDVLNGMASKGGNGGLKFFDRAKEPQLNILFRVASPAIRHQMSIQVRSLLKQEIQAWSKETGRTAPELLWQDDAGIE